MNDQPPQDPASVLRRFASVQRPAGERSKIRMGVKNERKLERMRERVKQMRGK